jgi:DNA repair exonuclease SbcCD ATPase subunit
MSVLDDLAICKYKLENIATTKQNLVDSYSLLDAESVKLEDNLKDIVLSRQFYKKAIDIVYERSIQELKDVLNSALGYIFYDKNLQIDIELSDKRGKSMTFVVKHNNRRVNLKRGMGMGVKCVISCILHIYYLQCKNSKKLFLDEAYSNISQEYIANFFDFISKLCSKLNFIIVLITHDPRFVQYANRVYEVSNGYVTLIKD